MVAESKRQHCLLKADEPVYPIGVAARMLGVHPRTLRIYENEGLIKPHYKSGRRLFSHNDIQWTACLRSMIHDDGISIPGIKKLLALVPCWEVAECPSEVHETCGAKVDLSTSSIRCKRCNQILEQESIRIETEKIPLNN